MAVARESAPDVALLDVQTPGKDGITAAAELYRELPSCRIVVCTTFGRPGYLSRAMAAGAVGFVVKDAPPEQLVDAVRRVHSGLRVVDPALAAESLATGQSPLTDRDMLRVASSGGTIADVAHTLSLSQGTVRNHLSAAIGKTGARTRTAAGCDVFSSPGCGRARVTAMAVPREAFPAAGSRPSRRRGRTPRCRSGGGSPVR